MGLKKICRVVGEKSIRYTYGDRGPLIKEIAFNGRIELMECDYPSYRSGIPKSLQDKLRNSRKMGPMNIYANGMRRWFRQDVQVAKRLCYTMQYHRWNYVGGNKNSNYFAKYDYGNVNSSKKT